MCLLYNIVIESKGEFLMSREVELALGMLPSRFASSFTVREVEVEGFAHGKEVTLTGDFSGQTIQVVETVSDVLRGYVSHIMSVNLNVYNDGYAFEEEFPDIVKIADEFHEEIESFLEEAGYETELGYGYGGLLDGERDAFMSLRRITLSRDGFNLMTFSNLLKLIGDGNRRIAQEKSRLGS